MKFSASRIQRGANADDADDLESGSIVGTLNYMSPEQAEGEDTNERSDIFSFGAVMYEMLTGTRAFDGDTKTAILAAILKDQPAPIQQFQPMAPRALDRVVRKCLEKKPGDRWQSTHDLKPTLELIDLAGPTSASASTTGSGVQPLAGLASRRKWLWSAVAVVVVAGRLLWLWAPVAKTDLYACRALRGGAVRQIDVHQSSGDDSFARRPLDGVSRPRRRRL